MAWCGCEATNAEARTRELLEESGVDIDWCGYPATSAAARTEEFPVEAGARQKKKAHEEGVCDLWEKLIRASRQAALAAANAKDLPERDEQRKTVEGLTDEAAKEAHSCAEDVWRSFAERALTQTLEKGVEAVQVLRACADSAEAMRSVVVGTTQAMVGASADQTRAPAEESSGLPAPRGESALNSASADAQPPVLARSNTDPCVTDLSLFHPEDAFELLPKGEFTRVCKVASGINGDVYKYSWRRGQESRTVAAKLLATADLTRSRKSRAASPNDRPLFFAREANDPCLEDALSDIGVLKYLASRHDLPLFLLLELGTFVDGDRTWLVTEFADGGELFQVVASRELGERERMRYAWQIFQAVDYLHRHHIGHRDISLENVLLKDGVVRVMDFGMAVRSHSSSGAPLRFFRSVGKDFYRAPECYCPETSAVRVTVPRDAEPGSVLVTGTVEVLLPENAVPGTACMAKTWGYAVCPADMFSCGVILFILCYRCPPWTTAKRTEQSFEYFWSHGDEGLSKLIRFWRLPLQSSAAMKVLDGLLRPNSQRRLTATAVLASEWLADFAHEQVPIHGLR